MKYRILKIIDVTGLTFLSPIVRLCYGEEPAVQIKKIGLYIVVPIVAFALFLTLWSVLAPMHKTKSGEVPTPAVVWDAAKGIWRFHAREGDKESAYTLDGPEREALLAQTEARLAELKPLEKAVNKQVEEAEKAHNEAVAAAVAPIRERYDKMRGEFRQAKMDRMAALKAEAARIPAGDTAAREAYLAKVRDHMRKTDAEKERLDVLRDKERELRSEPFEPLVQARIEQTRIAEEKQHLVKLAETLGQNNRNVKIAEASARLSEDKHEFYNAEGEKAYMMATRIINAEERIDKSRESEYAKPWTLPGQTIRSIGCVFLGFFIAVAIAIPVGILCGLNSVIMAALTPFIALFKPVSPIVWLPIVFIIVGGFIDRPDEAFVAPAFLSSAITVALCSLWPTLVNTALGVASIDKDHLNVARVLKLGFWSRLFRIVIPSSLPLIFAGMRISLGVGWMVLIAAELLSSSEGLGKFVWDMFNNGSPQTFAQMFVVVFVVGVIGLLLDRTMIVFQRSVSFDGAPAAI